MNNLMSPDTRIGILNGTVLALLYTINAGGLLQSCVVAAMGTAVSFIVSLMCKWAFDKFQKKGS